MKKPKPAEVITISELRARPTRDPLKLLQRRRRGFIPGPTVINLPDTIVSSTHIMFLDEDEP